MTVDEIIDLGESDQGNGDLWADVESELYSSAREASVECFPLDGSEDEALVEATTWEPTGSRDPTTLKQCPECGGARTLPVIVENRVKFFCSDCYGFGGLHLFR